jgi:hypothetical protein
MRDTTRGRGDSYFRRPAYPAGHSLDTTHYEDVTDEVAELRDVLRDLANALRTHVAFSTTETGECAWPEHSAGGMAFENSTAALARYDRLTGGNDA